MHIKYKNAKDLCIKHLHKYFYLYMFINILVTEICIFSSFERRELI